MPGLEDYIAAFCRSRRKLATFKVPLNRLSAVGAGMVSASTIAPTALETRLPFETSGSDTDHVMSYQLVTSFVCQYDHALRSYL